MLDLDWTQVGRKLDANDDATSNEVERRTSIILVNSWVRFTSVHAVVRTRWATIRRVTRYGTQPILTVLVLNHLSVSRVARAVGVNERTLRNYVMGVTRPDEEVVRRLTTCLDHRAELLFTPEALAAPPHRGPALNLTRWPRVPARLVRYVHKPTNG